MKESWKGALKDLGSVTVNSHVHGCCTPLPFGRNCRAHLGWARNF